MEVDEDELDDEEQLQLLALAASREESSAPSSRSAGSSAAAAASSSGIQRRPVQQDLSTSDSSVTVEFPPVFLPFRCLLRRSPLGVMSDPFKRRIDGGGHSEALCLR